MLELLRELDRGTGALPKVRLLVSCGLGSGNCKWRVLDLPGEVGEDGEAMKRVSLAQFQAVFSQMHAACPYWRGSWMKDAS